MNMTSNYEKVVKKDMYSRKKENCFVLSSKCV